MNPTENILPAPDEALLAAQATPDALPLAEEVPQPDERWDADKAATMAAVLKSDNQFDKQMEKRHQFVLEKRNPDHVKRVTAPQKEKLEKAKDEFAWFERNYGTDGELNHVSHRKASMDGHLANLEHTQANYDKARRGFLNRTEAEIDGNLKHIIVEIDKKLSPYEELYELNPTAFADLPTAEFMEISNRYQRASEVIDETVGYINRLRTGRQQIEDSMAKQVGATPASRIQSLIAEVKAGLGDEELAESIASKFTEVTNNSYDKTPHQMDQTYADLTDEYISKFEEKLTADQAAKQAIVAKYLPEEA